MHPINFPARTLALFSILLCAHPLAQAKEPSPTSQLEKQVGSDLLSAKASALESAVVRCIQDNRKESHRFAAAALASGRADANAIAPFLVIASIHALGKEITEHELTGIIYATVKVTPDVVLEIVDAASRNVSLKLVPTIVTAAIHAVPDPYKIVAAVGKTSPSQPKAPPEDRSFKNVRSFKESFKDSSKENFDLGESTQTLAEAIVATAINASGATDPAPIIAAADPALDNWLPLLGGPTVTSPVGTAGNANFGNEPRIESPNIPVVSK